MSSDVDASPLHPVVSRRWRLSPAYISVLLHCYCRCDEIPNRNAPVIVDALREFIEYGLIVAGGQCDHGFEVTPKGRALVQRTPAISGSSAASLGYARLVIETTKEDWDGLWNSFDRNRSGFHCLL